MPDATTALGTNDGTPILVATIAGVSSLLLIFIAITVVVALRRRAREAVTDKNVSTERKTRGSLAQVKFRDRRRSHPSDEGVDATKEPPPSARRSDQMSMTLETSCTS